MTLEMNRRQLIGVGVTGGLALTGAATFAVPYADAHAEDGDLFALGVASGDPLPDGVVLWTRLCPSPLAEDGGRGGMADRVQVVQWEVAEDPAFQRVVRRGKELARPQWAHSVHAEVSGLRPGREYWYRFRADRQISPVGRTKTAPAFDADLAALTFGFTSCINLPNGYFTALGHAARDQLDVMLCLGDYIYEGPGSSELPGRYHLGEECFTLADYRLRYNQYKSDPDLRAVHASTPFINVPDDHEVENNWAGDISQIDDEPDQDPAVFRQRRAMAFQAMYENLPFRRAQLPAGPDMKLYRRIRYGRLLDISMIDTRQYRDDQLETCAGDCDARNDPNRTMLGEQQEQWLVDGLAGSPARWQVVGNQSIMFDVDQDAGPGLTYPQDNWNGYAGSRQSIFDQLHEADVQNLVVVSGDAHRNAAADLKLDFFDESSPTLGAEFLGTSVSSGSDGTDENATSLAWQAENPHIKFVNNQRGYQRVRVERDTLQVDYQVLDYVSRPDSPIRTRTTLTVEAGRAGLAGTS